MPHMHDPRTTLDHIIWHKDPIFELNMRHLIDSTKPDMWVETGSHMGWTSMWVGDNYPNMKIRTVEIAEMYYNYTKDNLAPYPNAQCKFGDSKDYLKEILPELQSNLPLFWLDAHWYPPVPLRDECAIVASLDRYICVIDDWFCYDPFFEGDGLEYSGAYRTEHKYVVDILGNKCWRPNYEWKPGMKGYGLFMKGVDYTPTTYMKLDTLTE